MRLRTALILSVIGASFLFQARASDCDDDEDKRKSKETKKILDDSSKYNKFWGWMTDWQKKTDAVVVPQAKANRQCGLQIMKRNACLESKQQSFHDDIENIWEDLVESMTKRTWGITKNKRDKNYGKWKISTNVCSAGNFKDPQSSACLSCPVGCSFCNGPDKCLSCKRNYTLVEGYNFGYCMPDCQKGKYHQHLYTDDQSFCKKANLQSRPQTLSQVQMNSHCTKCPDFCDDCVYNEVSGKVFCHQSRKGFTFDSVKGNCKPVTSCQAGQYKLRELARNQVLTESTANLDDYICKDCKNGCGSCSNNQTCNTCKSGFILRTFTSTNKTCLKCPDNCQTCSLNDKGQAICKTCVQRYYPFSNSTQCVLNKTCPAGQWFNDATMKCQSCPANCLTCKQGAKNGTTVCVTCPSDKKLNSTVCIDKCNIQKEFLNKKNSTCTKCPIGQYPDKANQKCRPCTYKNCQDCIFKVTSSSIFGTFGQEECLTCKQDYWFDSKWRMCRTQCNSTAIFDFYSQSCQNCKPGYYKNPSDDTCRPCSTNCLACELPQNSSKSVCKICKSGLKIDEVEKGVCRQNCPSGQYIDAQGWQCKVCPSGKYVNEDSRGCGICPKYCVGCNKNQTTKKLECTKCDSSSQFDKNSKLCVPQCKPTSYKYYFETESCRQCPPYQSYSARTKKCEPCNSNNCMDCIHSLFNKTLPKCFQCDSATKMDYKSMTCRPVCNSTTYYNNLTNKCDQCPPNQMYIPSSKKCIACNITNCNQCEFSGDAQICKACNTGFEIHSTSGKCVQKCQENFYFSNTDLKCVNCTAGYYYNSTVNQCEVCPKNCSTCKTINGQFTCQQCQSGFILDGSNNICRLPCFSPSPIYDSTLRTCIACPTSTFFNQYVGGCIQCPSNCSSCSFDSLTNKTSCQSCLNGWILDEQFQRCKPSCPANQQYDFASAKCSVCPTGYAVNTTTQICKACPANCTSCVYNTTTKAMQCLSCINGQELDQVKKTCRVSCSANQYYSSNANQCISCLAGQYLNSFTMTCQACSSNCTSCIFNNQTQLPECLSCKNGSVLDSTQLKCKTICSQSQYFNWDTGLCTGCSAGYFINPSVEQCQICPDGCATCSYNYSQQSVECQSCNSNTLVLDSSQKLCRDKCNSTAQYNWDQLQCINCLDSEYLEPQSQSCQSCPSNCQSCFFNSSRQTECNTCAEQFTLKRQTCIEVCNQTAYYDWSVGSCQTCPDGQWLNPNTLQCDYCTLGCNRCELDDVNPQTSQCLECLPTLILDKEKCRKPCESNQFYDWNNLDCSNCTYPCTSCSDSQKCTACEEMFTYLESDGTCINKCNSATQIWNVATKQCDYLRKFNLTVTAASNRVWRCRNTSISTIGSGFTSNETPQYSWSFEILQGGLNKNNWLADINSLLATANLNKAKTIIISSAFTEKVTDNTTIKFIVTLNVNGQTTTNSTNLIVDPYVYLTIGNYSKSYLVWSADGLPLYPAFYYPECPIFKGPQAVPASVSIGCSLYSSSNNLIKALPYCQIQKTELAPGNNYFIKYYYAPNPLQSGASTGLRDTISVYAYAQLPACNIANSSEIYVRKADTLYLSTSIINGKSTFVYKWSCNSLTAGGLCGISSTTQNTPDLSLPASTLTQGAIYNFSMNMWENTVFQGACSARVEVVSPTQTSIAVSMIDQANSWNYIDPKINQGIQCYQFTEMNASLSYDWKVLNKTTKSFIYQSGQSVSGYSQSGSMLNIVMNTLGTDSYDISCTAQNLKYKGTTTKTYSTSPIIQISPSLDISPSTGGVAQDTVFTLTATKPPGYDLWCQFGQMTSENQEIDLSDGPEVVYSNQPQTLLTKLDRVKLQDTQELFINCFDDTGSYARTVKNVIVKSSPTATTSFIEMDDLLLQSEQNIQVEETVNEVDVEQENLNITQDSMSKSVKIVIAIIPIVVIIVLSLSPVLLSKKQEWNNVPQVEKSASKIDNSHEIDSINLVQQETVFSGAKLVVLLKRIQSISVRSLQPKLKSSLLLLSCFTISLAFLQVKNDILGFALSYMAVLTFEVILTLLARFQRLQVILMSVLLAIQPFVVILCTFNLPQDSFIKWTKFSYCVLIMSAIIQDLMVVPISKGVYSKICKRQV